MMRKYSKGPLYDLLNSKLGAEYTNKMGNLDVVKVAEGIGITGKAVYAWFKTNRVPAGHVESLRKLIGVENLTYEELAPFVFRQD